jgi:hypothetical protein
MPENHGNAVIDCRNISTSAKCVDVLVRGDMSMAGLVFSGFNADVPIETLNETQVLRVNSTAWFRLVD